MSELHSAIMSHMAAYIHARRHELGLSLEDVAKRAGSTKVLSAAPRPVGTPSQVEEEQMSEQERDIWEVANQLGGYVDPSTDERLARFLIREANEAEKLAHRIQKLERENAELREALRPFSDMSVAYEREDDDAPALVALVEGRRLNLKVGDLRHARRLAEQEE